MEKYSRITPVRPLPIILPVCTEEPTRALAATSPSSGTISGNRLTTDRLKKTLLIEIRIQSVNSKAIPRRFNLQKSTPHKIIAAFNRISIRAIRLRSHRSTIVPASGAKRIVGAIDTAIIPLSDMGDPVSLKMDHKTVIKKMLLPKVSTNAPLK
ncbi:MAG: hypothetical protein QY317_01660 [Candidatus Jettenia caeni]|nr:MAG: hypothetical protein QY317_01660 [Candidatus Jettenia caeni]